MDQQRAPMKKSTVFLLAILCCIMWGSITPVIKLSYAYFGISSQDVRSLMSFAGIRYIFCGLTGIAFGSVKNRRLLAPKRGSWGMILKLAAVQTLIQQFAFYVSLTHISGISASILGSLNNFFSILIACLVYRQEKLTAKKLLGCALGFLGVILINMTGGRMFSGFSLLGEGMLLVSCITCGASYAMIKEYSAREDVLTLNSYQFLFGGLALLLIGFEPGQNFHSSSFVGYLLFAYMVAMPITAFTIWGALLKLTPVSQLSAFGFINPIAGVILSSVFLREGQDVSAISCVLSLALVSAGIWVANSARAQD